MIVMAEAHGADARLVAFMQYLRVAVVAGGAWLLAPSLAQELPLKPQSVRFAVIGDNGTGEKPQYEIGQQMERVREKVAFDFVLMLGDNIYGGENPADLKGFVELNRGAMARDRDGNPVFLAKSAWEVGYVADRYPSVKFAATRER